jgi:hypothetical protein
VWTFYDISGAGMHLRGTRKTSRYRKVWPEGAIPSRKVTRLADLQSGPLGISFQGSEYSFFFAIFRNCLWSAGRVRLRFLFPG